MSAQRLHIPHPPARPGERPDFSYLKLSRAGSVARPPIDAPFNELADYPNALIRVLDDEHRAVGDWDPQLDPALLVA